MHNPAAGWPRITILTPCFNGVRYVADAIDSVWRQGYADLEHIVLDAGSTDGTLELLSRYPAIRVISEPDHGAHDAMNKGIARATGEVIGFLNVDDLYADGVLVEVGRLFADNPALDVVVGSSIVFEDDGTGRRQVIVARDHDNESGFWLPELAFGHPGFNGRFYRRRVFDQVGLFDNSYYIAADRHFLMRIALAGLKARRLDHVGIYYRHHADSQTMNPEQRFAEAIAREHARMAQEFLNLTQDDGMRRRVFAGWRAFESVKLVVRDLSTGRVREAIRALVDLSRQSPLWPLHFLYGLRLRHRARQAERRGTAAAHQSLPK